MREKCTLRIRPLVLFLMLGTHLLADGGTIQFRQQKGQLLVTLFSSPSPLRAGGKADLSILLEGAQTNEPLLDANIRLTLQQPGNGPIVAEPNRAQATNKLLYATTVEIPRDGTWSVSISIELGGKKEVVAGTMNVQPPAPPIAFYWPYFTVVPAAIGLFVLNQYLRSPKHTKRTL